MFIPLLIFFCSGCPDGSQPAVCAVNPCDLASCPAYPNAYCRPDYCKGCDYVEFYDQRRQVVDCTQVQPPGEIFC